MKTKKSMEGKNPNIKDNTLLRTSNPEFQHIIDYFLVMIAMLKNMDNTFIDDREYLCFNISMLNEMIKPLNNLKSNLLKYLND
ncbi:MAG: hypothetical protein ACE5D2_07950 [Fidelibacterota bacterium]